MFSWYHLKLLFFHTSFFLWCTLVLIPQSCCNLCSEPCFSNLVWHAIAFLGIATRHSLAEKKFIQLLDLQIVPSEKRAHLFRKSKRGWQEQCNVNVRLHRYCYFLFKHISFIDITVSFNGASSVQLNTYNCFWSIMFNVTSLPRFLKIVPHLYRENYWRF